MDDLSLLPLFQTDGEDQKKGGDTENPDRPCNAEGSSTWQLMLLLQMHLLVSQSLGPQLL